MKPILIALVFLGQFGCAIPLSASGKTVQLLTRTPPKDCEELGDVSGFGQSLADLQNDMRNNAAAMHANVAHVRWDTEKRVNTFWVEVYGIAYHCITAPPVTPMQSSMPSPT